MVRGAWVLVLMSTVGCRQENPSWRGPVGSTDVEIDATSSGARTSSETDEGPMTEASSGGEACPEPLRLCGAQCVDLATDGRNCGGCSTRCRGNQRCVEGSCEDR